MIISNIGSHKHFNVVKEFAQQSDELIFASPFLFKEFDDFLSEIITDSIRTFTIITTLKPNIDDFVFKSSSFISFIDFLDQKNIEWNIHINNKLHGKIYLFKKNSEIINGIITSANLTNNGMANNHEWGVTIESHEDLSFVSEQLFSSLQYKSLSLEQVIKLMLKVDKYNDTYNQQKSLISGLNKEISEILEKENNFTFDENKNYFIKPFGSSDEKIWDGDYSNETKMFFSKRRPNAVSIGDILIAYAVGPAAIVSVFEVNSDPINTEEEGARWPWYVDVTNITPELGTNWSIIDLKIKSLTSDYLNHFPDGCVTKVGGQTLGALNFGADKINLDHSYARYILEKIKKT